MTQTHPDLSATSHTIRTSTKPNWKFWTFWVSVNAIASFIWALMLEQSLTYISGMIVGIVIFIIFYTLMDTYLLRAGLSRWHDALIKGVYIKAGLQLLNLSIFLNIPLCPEMWAGVLAITVVEKVFFLNGAVGDLFQSFWYAFACTLLTGALLSMVVGVISLIAGGFGHAPSHVTLDKA